MMKYSYFPGCSANTTGKSFTVSTSYVAEKIGVELVEIPDWNCCGTSAAALTSPELAVALPARSLAISERELPGLDVVAPCAGCYRSLKTSVAFARESEDNRTLIKKIIKYAVSRDVTRCDSLGQRVGHTKEAAEAGAEWWNKDMLSLVENDKLQIADCRLEIEENTRYLHAIVDLCNAHNVQPVIVQMPVMAEYKRLLPKEQVALMDDVLLSLNSCAIYIDASELEIPEEGWYNTTHLTKEASEEFTMKIVHSACK